MLDDFTITALLREQGADNLNATAREMVRQANQAGGKDNITVLLVRVDEAVSLVASALHSPILAWLGDVYYWLFPRRRKAASEAIR
jgi:serine/threonine protein phosphatase PrpC